METFLIILGIASILHLAYLYENQMNEDFDVTMWDAYTMKFNAALAVLFVMSAGVSLLITDKGWSIGLLICYGLYILYLAFVNSRKTSTLIGVPATIIQMTIFTIFGVCVFIIIAILSGALKNRNKN